MALRKLTVNTKQHQRMLDAWLEYGTVESMAQAAGVKSAVAKRMLERGDEYRPPIRDTARKLIQRAMKEADEDRERENRAIRGIMRKSLRDAVTAIQRTELVPNGTPNAAGRIEVTESAYNRMLQLTQRVLSIRDTLDGYSQNVGIQQNVAVSVNRDAGNTDTDIRPAPERIREECKSFKRTTGLQADLGHYEREQRAVAVVRQVMLEKYGQDAPKR